VTNIGQGTGNDVKMTIDRTRLSGAHLLSPGTQTIDRLAPGDSGTLEYRFRSEVTGAVVASYLRFETSGGVDVTGRLNFTLGVGERQVAHSPDTLVLPATVRALPTSVVSAAMRVLGHAWSAATATTLLRASSDPPRRRSSRRAWPWRRRGCGSSWASRSPSAARLLLDFHGGLFDPGFDQALRETAAGPLRPDACAGARDRGGGDLLRYQEDVAEIAARPAVPLRGAPELHGSLAAQLMLADGRTDHDPAGPAGPGRRRRRDRPRSQPAAGLVSSLASPPYAVHVLGTAEAS
jgi:hypothetical protein